MKGASSHELQVLMNVMKVVKKEDESGGGATAQRRCSFAAREDRVCAACKQKREAEGVHVR